MKGDTPTWTRTKDQKITISNIITNRTSAIIIADIQVQDPSARIVRSRVLGIRQEIDKRVAIADAALSESQGEHDPDHVGNAIAYPFNFGRAALVTEILQLRAVLEIMEALPAHAIATERLVSLFAELEEAKAREAAAEAEAAWHAVLPPAAVPVEATTSPRSRTSAANCWPIFTEAFLGGARPGP